MTATSASQGSPSGPDRIARAWPRRYDSYADFYRAQYGSSVVAITPTALPGVTFVDADQGAGDWSDAPTPDLAITSLLSPQASVSFDVGSGLFNGQIRRLHGVLNPPDAATSVYVQGPHRIRMLGVRYADLLSLTSDHGLPLDGDFRALHAGPLTDADVHRIADLLWREARQGSPRGALYVEGSLLTLAATLAYLAQRPVRVATGGLAGWQLRRTTEYLNDHFAEPVRLAELAAIARLSVFHFARAFKISTGQPPHGYQTRLRIERAREMLDQPTLSVTEIALGLGYESSQSLSRAFQLHVGCSPSQWRRRHSG